MTNTSGIKILKNGKLHAVRYIWEDGSPSEELVNKGITRVKSGIAREDSYRDYFKNMLRTDSTGRKMIMWDDNYIDQNLPYEQAAEIVTKMDNIFCRMMIDKGYRSIDIHNVDMGTEFYEGPNRKALLKAINDSWNDAYRIAYEAVTKTECPDAKHISEFKPRNMQQEAIIDPVVDYLKNNNRCSIEVPGGSGKSKCSARISEIMSQGKAWKVLGIAPTVSTTIQLCQSFSDFYKGQTGKRMLKLYLVGTANPNDYRLLKAWANVISVSDDRLPEVMKEAYESNEDCAFFVVNKSVSDFLPLAKKHKVDFKDWFTIIDEIHYHYASENGTPKMEFHSNCAIINPKFNDLFGKRLGLSATHINRNDIEDLQASFNDDEDKFGKCVVQISEAQAREWKWICDKRGIIVPIPTDEVFTNALADNATFSIEMFGQTKEFNPVTFVGVEGIRLLAPSHNKMLVLTSSYADARSIIDVLKLLQVNDQIDSDFELIYAHRDMDMACVNRFNREGTRVIMVTTRWIATGVDTYTCDCTLPLYTPESRSFARQFGMRGDRIYGDKVSTFAFVASESRLEDNPWFESLASISNGEEINIISQSQFREERDRVIGGRSNITLLRSEPAERPEVALQWEQVSNIVSTKAYLSDDGKAELSKILGVNCTWYSYNMVRDFVHNAGYSSLAEWAKCKEGLRYYAAACNRGWHLDICEELGLKYSKEFNAELFEEFLQKYNITSCTTKKEFDEYAKQDNCTSLRRIAIREGWMKKDFLCNAKPGFDAHDKPTVDMVTKWITDNNLQGIGRAKARKHSTKKDKSDLGIGALKMVATYCEYVDAGKIDGLLEKSGRNTGKKINVIDKEGNIVYTFNKLKDAGNALGINTTSISNVLRGDAKTAGGYKFEKI
jgi:superfamily II DNA or RNA helicase